MAAEYSDTSFAILSGHFGALAVALGSFPLAVGHYRSTTASRGRSDQVFGVWLGLVGRFGPRAHPVALPPADIRSEERLEALPQ